MALESNKGLVGKVVVVLVRGLVGVKRDIRETIHLLNLKSANNCVVLDATPVNLGMLRKAKDYLTWGEIDENILKELVEKRGIEYLGRLTDSKSKINYNKYFEFNGKKYHKTFRLNPPKKGLESKGIKFPYKMGGALGYRASKIKDLILRMI